MMPREICDLVDKGTLHLKMPVNSISDEGREELDCWLGEHETIRTKVRSFYNTQMAFLNSLGTEWTNTRGNFPKRMFKALKKIGIVLTQIELSEIGTIAAGHCLKHSDWLVDVVGEFNWDAGDFGDSGSCFWESRKPARVVMEEHDFLALRFYEEVNGKGLARCWIGYNTKSTEPVAVVFNAYSKNSVVSLLTMARLLSFATNLSYKACELVNEGSPDDVLWINNGSGYLVGNIKHLETLSETKPFDLCCHIERLVACCHCGENVDEENAIEIDGRLYCPDCVSRCECCEEEFLNNQLKEGYCNECYGKLWTQEEEEVCEENIRSSQQLNFNRQIAA